MSTQMYLCLQLCLAGCGYVELVRLARCVYVPSWLSVAGCACMCLPRRV
jgi:hypothetical protein